MKKGSGLFALGLAVITAMSGWVLDAKGESSSDLILNRLKQQYPVTVFSGDASQVLTAGAVVTLQKDGFLVFRVSVPAHPTSTYKSGKLSQGFGDTFAACLANGLNQPNGCNDVAQKKLTTGDKFWISAIVVGKKDIELVAVTDPYDDGRYIGQIKFPFEKGAIPTPDEALRMISEVVVADPGQNQPPPDQAGQQPQGPPNAPPLNSAQGYQPAGISGTYELNGIGSRLVLQYDNSFTKSVGSGQGQGSYAVDGDNLTLTFASTGYAQHFKIQGINLVDLNTRQAWTRTGDAPGTVPSSPVAFQAPSAPLPDIAPPPPPADVAPPTIALGQTADQVTAAFGQPLKSVKVGTKSILFYKDMKVTFTNGKVSDVE